MILNNLFLRKIKVCYLNAASDLEKKNQPEYLQNLLYVLQVKKELRLADFSSQLVTFTIKSGYLR